MYEEQLSKMKESMKNSSDYFWLPARHVGVTALGKALLDGDINNKWRGIDSSACDCYSGVRPACVISDSAPVKKKKNGGYKFDWKEVIK